jgi:AhpD family alkylhydroperoxidase
MKQKGKTILGAVCLGAAIAAVAVKSIAKSTPAQENPAHASALSDIEKSFGFVPRFLSDIPPEALPGTWQEMKTLQMNPKTALPPKVKELIGLGVAAQIPCQYCVLAHSEFARANGASEAEIGEAVALAATTRHWSTFLNGEQIDEAKFRSEISMAINNMKKAKQSGAAAPKPVRVIDGATALQDIRQTYGFEPEFLKRFPDAARAGAWQTMRDVDMNPNTALPAKTKDLIGLAVSAQVPCRYCIISDTEFSKQDGATDEEISEAVAMASFTREMSTFVNGMRTDADQFKSDISRMVKNAQASRAQPASGQDQVR